MNKKLTLLFSIFILLSCNGIKKERNIDGNWYSSSLIKLENGEIDYAEIFIKNDTVHICSEYVLMMFPRNMILEKDSLFFFSKMDSNFKGKILTQTKNSFELGIDNEHKRIYYKLENVKNLESLIKEEITEKEFYFEFNERRINRYEKLGIEN